MIEIIKIDTITIEGEEEDKIEADKILITIRTPEIIIFKKMIIELKDIIKIQMREQEMDEWVMIEWVMKE